MSEMALVVVVDASVSIKWVNPRDRLRLSFLHAPETYGRGLYDCFYLRLMCQCVSSPCFQDGELVYVVQQTIQSGLFYFRKPALCVLRQEIIEAELFRRSGVLWANAWSSASLKPIRISGSDASGRSN